MQCILRPALSACAQAVGRPWLSHRRRTSTTRAPPPAALPRRRLPGPLALVQTEGTGAQHISHINALSLAEIEAACPAVPAEELAAATDGSAAGAPLTTIRREGVTVRALTVVAVHAGLLGGAAPAGTAPSTAAADGARGVDAAAEQRALLRAAARLTWGLAGLVFELMHRQAGHWPSLGAVERQALAGAALTQLYK